jgi:hypothetical protein
MRALNRNERLMATALAAMLFLFVNFAGMRWIGGAMRDASAEVSRLESESGAARTLLQERPYWLARQAWVAEHPPGIYDERTSRSKYVQDVQTAVQAQSLRIESQQPLETERDGRLALVGMEVTVNGRLEAIVRWLHALQQPGKYETVRNFTLKQADDANTMEATVRLGKVLRSADLASYP